MAFPNSFTLFSFITDCEDGIDIEYEIAALQDTTDVIEEDSLRLRANIIT